MENCTHHATDSRYRERGNVLFLILIAVALFAALSFAVTHSSRSGGHSADKEKSALVAAQFAQYGAQISTALTRVKISNGCSETEISFENPIMSHPDYWGGSGNTLSPADGRCNIFGANGGGAVYWDARKQLPNDDPIYNYLTFTTSVAVHNVGTPESDIIMYFAMDDSTKARQICEAFNERMGISGDTGSGTTRVLDWGYATGNGLTYQGAPTGTMEIGDDPDPSGFSGQLAGCLSGGSSHDSDSQILYYVLQAR